MSTKTVTSDLVERTRISLLEGLCRTDLSDDVVAAYCFGHLRAAVRLRPDSEIADVLRGVLAARDEAYEIANRRAVAVTK